MWEGATFIKCLASCRAHALSHTYLGSLSSERVREMTSLSPRTSIAKGKESPTARRAIWNEVLRTRESLAFA